MHPRARSGRSDPEDRWALRDRWLRQGQEVRQGPAYQGGRSDHRTRRAGTGRTDGSARAGRSGRALRTGKAARTRRAGRAGQTDRTGGTDGPHGTGGAGGPGRPGRTDGARRARRPGSDADGDVEGGPHAPPSRGGDRQQVARGRRILRHHRDDVGGRPRRRRPGAGRRGSPCRSCVPKPVPWMKRFAPSASAWRISGPSPWSESPLGSLSRHRSRSSLPSFPLSRSSPPARASGTNASAAATSVATPQCDSCAFPLGRSSIGRASGSPEQRRHFDSRASQLRHEPPRGVGVGSGRAWSRFRQQAATKSPTPSDVLSEHLVDSTPQFHPLSGTGQESSTKQETGIKMRFRGQRRSAWSGKWDTSGSHCGPPGRGRCGRPPGSTRRQDRGPRPEADPDGVPLRADRASSPAHRLAQDAPEVRAAEEEPARPDRSALDQP